MVAYIIARSRKFLIHLVVLATTGTFLIVGAQLPAKVFAGAADFNPNAIVSDPVFTASNAMSVTDIQNFLVAQHSVLATLPTAQLGDGAAGRSAAQIIYDASHLARTDFDSHDYGPSNPLIMSLNPGVILVTLQKEQSLVTGIYDPNSPTTATALAAAMGMGCPDNSGCNNAYVGFSNQVTYGAAQLMLNYYRAGVGLPGSGLYRLGQTYTLVNTTGPPYNAAATQDVTIGNATTSALYQYTPHVYNGNYNFWYYFTLWFSVVAYKPVLAVNPADGSVYVIDDGYRWPVTAQGFIQWGFQWSDVQPITPTQLALPANNLFTPLIKTGDGTVYFIDQGRKRVITSPRIFAQNNLNWGDISSLSDTIFAKVPYGLPLGSLVMSTTGDGTIYLVSGGVLYPVPGPIFANDPVLYFMPEVGQVPAYVLSSYPIGKPMTNLVYPTPGDGSDFLLDGAYGYRFSAAVAQAWNFDLSLVRKVGNDITDKHRAGGLLTTLAMAAGGDGTIFLIQAGQKFPITHATWIKNKYLGSDVRTLTGALLGTLPTGPAQ